MDVIKPGGDIDIVISTCTKIGEQIILETNISRGVSSSIIICIYKLHYFSSPIPPSQKQHAKAVRVSDC